MEATSQNGKIARTIINVLAENGCTVTQASSILRYVDEALRHNAMVRKVDGPIFKSPLSIDEFNCPLQTKE